jgi:dynein heavy chain
MNKMTEEWSKLSFEPMVCAGKDYKEDKANAISKPQHILNGDAIEEIQNALDDHIIKTQTMKGSPFAKFMLDKIGIWENKLIKT